MRCFAFERRWRDALLEAMIPAPGDGLPALADIDRGRFWPRFEATAPLELQLAVRATAVVLGVLPLGLGYGAVFIRLDPARRDAVLQRASALPGIGAMLEVVKVVACFAYFDDPAVQARIRGLTAP